MWNRVHKSVTFEMNNLKECVISLPNIPPKNYLDSMQINFYTTIFYFTSYYNLWINTHVMKLFKQNK